MSKKKDRAWFVCPQWAELVSSQYASDVDAARALKTEPKVLARLRPSPDRQRSGSCEPLPADTLSSP